VIANQFLRNLLKELKSSNTVVAIPNGVKIPIKSINIKKKAKLRLLTVDVVGRNKKFPTNQSKKYDFCVGFFLLYRQYFFACIALNY